MFLRQRFPDGTIAFWGQADSQSFPASLRDFSLKALRKQIALVTQNVVLFNDTIMSWDQGSSSSPSYALYVSGGKGNQYLVPATTNLTLRTGTSNQILLDFQNTALPGGNRDAGSFDMATLVFSVADTGDGLAAFTLSNNSPGNILQLADGSNPANALSGDFDVVTPEPTTALLVGLGLAGLGVAGRRRA